MDWPDNASDKLKEFNVKFISKLISQDLISSRVNSKIVLLKLGFRARN